LSVSLFNAEEARHKVLAWQGGDSLGRQGEYYLAEAGSMRTLRRHKKEKPSIALYFMNQ
jgi:hypothetical protein